MNTLKWFLHTSKGIRLRSLLNLITGTTGVLLDFAFIWATKYCVDIATGQVQTQLRWGAVALVVVLLSTILLSFTKTWISALLGIKSQNLMQLRVFQQVMGSVWMGREQQHSGDVVNRLERDVRDVTNVITNTMPSFAIVLFRLCGAFLILYSMDKMLACLLLCIAPAFLVLSKLYIKRMRELNRGIRKTDSEIQSIIQESLQHRVMLKTMEMVEDTVERLDLTQQDLRRQVRFKTRFSSLSNSLVSIGFSAGYTVTFLWAVMRLQDGSITYGMMIAFIQLVGQIQGPFRDMTRFIPILISCLTSAERLMELESMPQEQVGDPISFPAGAGIRFNHVTYAYDKEEGRRVIEDFSYDFPIGSTTAILGETGAGKTTLIRLILALLVPQKGSVEFYDGNISVKASPRTRCNLVYVPQGNTLMSGSIRQNLLLGKSDASDEELWEVLKLACADFVNDIPEGLDFLCGEGGQGLSEGQAQRLTIARALLRNGSILLLDEATSALDVETEARLLDNLTERTTTRQTVICITHRPAITAHCSQTLKLKRNVG